MATPIKTAARPRQVDATSFPPTRRVTMAALRAGRRRTPVHGLIDVDVTLPKQLIAGLDGDISFTAFIVASVARAAAGHPQVHPYRDWRGRLVTHRHVDINTMVEIATEHGAFPLAVVVRDADVRTVADISAQLRNAKHQPRNTPSGRFTSRSWMAFTRVPLLAGLLFRALGRSITARQRSGTIAVTAIGMFGGGGGYGITAPTIYPLGVVVGGVSDRPRVVEGSVMSRQVLDLTVTIDHNLVDGAPAARFVADLRASIESAAALDPAA